MKSKESGMSDHSHHHHHDHGHAHESVAMTGKAFAIGVTLNLAFVGIEVGFGFWSNSLSLLADAGHNFSDVIGLLAAWGAMLLARRAASTRFTYGLRSSTILAALANAMLLLVAVGGIVWEAIQRLRAPADVNDSVMIWVALVGVGINVGTALLFMKGSKQDLNIRGAYLHMMADAAVSVGVVVAALGIRWSGWLWLDPAVSIAIALVIFIGTWGLFKESVRLSLHAVPDSIDIEKISAFLARQPGVQSIHDLHVWAISTTETALTAHLLMSGDTPSDHGHFLAHLAEELKHHHGISHSTFQVEHGGEQYTCRLAAKDGSCGLAVDGDVEPLMSLPAR